MAKLCLLLLGVSLVTGGPSLFPVPDPYRWDETFTVQMPQLDDEHRGLFNVIMKIEAENNQANLLHANKLFHDHFELEENLFEQTMGLDYIKDHKGKHNSFLLRFNFSIIT